ncbi:MAG: hypothetical protein ABI273_18520 [Lacunisphaera sp.]
MKTKRTSKFPAAIILLGAVFAFANVAHAETKAPKSKVTTETKFIGPATEQVVVTEKYKDGTVIRIVQIIHRDGSSETSGIRQTTTAKS